MKYLKLIESYFIDEFVIYAKMLSDAVLNNNPNAEIQIQNSDSNTNSVYRNTSKVNAHLLKLKQKLPKGTRFSVDAFFGGNLNRFKLNGEYDIRQVIKFLKDNPEEKTNGFRISFDNEKVRQVIKSYVDTYHKLKYKGD